MSKGTLCPQHSDGDEEKNKLYLVQRAVDGVLDLPLDGAAKHVQQQLVQPVD